MYKLELHAHSKPVSDCATASAREVIEAYKAAGYQGIVSTNHINFPTFRSMPDASWDEKMDFYMSGYHELVKEAGDDFDVLFGCEINLSKRGQGYIPNDYLVFGVTEEWLRAMGDVRDFTLKQLSEEVRRAGFLLVGAHPFRYGCVIADDTLLDGVEVYNGNKWHDSHDYLTQLWAEKKNLIQTTGSDFHAPQDLTVGGIETEERITDNEKLLKTLRSGNYRLIRP